MKTLLFRCSGFEHVPGGERLGGNPIPKEDRGEVIEQLAREREGWINVLGDYIQSVKIPSLALMRYMMAIIEETEELLIPLENGDIGDSAGFMYIEQSDAAMGLEHLEGILEEYARSGEAVEGVVEMLEFWRDDDFKVMASGLD
jgi:hypothetical protein